MAVWRCHIRKSFLFRPILEKFLYDRIRLASSSPGSRFMHTGHVICIDAVRHNYKVNLLVSLLKQYSRDCPKCHHGSVAER